MTWMRLVVAAFSLLSFVAWAQLPTQLPIETYAKLPDFSMPRLSPSASRLLYRTVVDDKDMFIIKDLKSRRMLGQVLLEDYNPTNAYFIDEDNVVLLAYKHMRLKGYRGLHNAHSAFVYNLQQHSLQQILIPGVNVNAGQTDFGRIMGFSEDNTIAYMGAYGSEKFYLLSVKLTGDRRHATQVEHRGDAFIIDYFINAQGKLLAFESYNNETNEHSVTSLISGKAQKIFKETVPMRERSFVGVTPEENALVMIAANEQNQDAYYTMALTDGKVSAPIFAKPNKEIARVISNSQRRVVGVQYTGWRPDYAFFDKNLENKFTQLQKQMPNNTFTLVDHSEDWQSLLIMVEGEQAPTDYYLYTQAGFQYLASARASIDPSQVNPVFEYQYTAKDGLTIPSLLTVPVGYELGKNTLPTIVMPHGGPESNDHYGFDWLAQFFANRGMAVLQPQFRGSTGFGNDFIAKGYGQWGKKMQTDLDDGLADLVAKGIANPNKVCIVGWSYGGYAALAATAFSPDTYRCAVSINGVSDLTEMLKTEKRQYGEDHWVVSYWQKAMQGKDINFDDLAKRSPINHIDTITTPILLIAGENDEVVLPEQSSDMADALEDADKPVTYIELDDEGHQIHGTSASRLKTLTAMARFIEQHLN